MPACEHCAHEPSYKVREQQQQPYRGLWQGIVERINEMSPDMPIYKENLGHWIAELWNEQPDGKDAFALNTTHYGRETEFSS